MRYWAYFSAKLIVAGGVLYGLLLLLSGLLPEETRLNEYDAFRNGPLRLVNNLAFMGWFLLCAGVLYLIIRDQRYRCRVCLRRLRMPIETGSWGQMLQLGRPRIEYICPYGHGTLKAEELQISGLANPEWTPHSDDMWDELYAASKEPGDQP
ncbi:MAG: hypothetical protein P4L56_16360 [Candidatus Sulfopaludibacter sp.]|nr:hypothetical protein [Candidatus Sulfopaludibacter sp.]